MGTKYFWENVVCLMNGLTLSRKWDIDVWCLTGFSKCIYRNCDIRGTLVGDLNVWMVVCIWCFVTWEYESVAEWCLEYGSVK